MKSGAMPEPLQRNEISEFDLALEMQLARRRAHATCISGRRSRRRDQARDHQIHRRQATIDGYGAEPVREIGPIYFSKPR
jgi:hypothetical protein